MTLTKVTPLKKILRLAVKNIHMPRMKNTILSICSIDVCMNEQYR